MTLYSPAHITAIPDTVDYLISLFQTTCPYDSNNEPIRVWFGVQLGVWQAPTTIEINKIQPIMREWAELGPTYRVEEHFSVWCKITVFSGEGMGGTPDFQASKNSVFSVWGALEKAVANDPTLGGNVRVCRFDDVNYEPTTDAAGRAAGMITWAITCEARVTTLS